MNNNIKLWNRIIKSKKFDPTFPSLNIVYFVKYNLPKKNRKKFKVLDVGFGNGMNLIYLKKLGFDVFGIDASKYAVDLQKKNFSKSEFKKKIKLNTFQKIEFKNNFFDAVIADGTIYYANLFQFKETIEGIYRILKKNCFARLYLKTKKDISYKLSKQKKTSLLIKKGWEKGMTLTFLSAKQVKYYFNKFREVKIGIEEFNHINHKKKHSYWIITAKK